MSKPKPAVYKSRREPVYKLDEFAAGVARPGILLNLRGYTPDEGRYKLGTLWVFSHADNVHYLLQTSHRKHCHRVQAVFWTSVIANCVRGLIDAGMRSGDLTVYTMLRDAGIIPIDWKAS